MKSIVSGIQLLGMQKSRKIYPITRGKINQSKSADLTQMSNSEDRDIETVNTIVSHAQKVKWRYRKH